MPLANPDLATHEEVAGLIERLRANRLPPPNERRAIRKRAQASLKDIAEALGVEVMTVSRWERGMREPWPKHRAAYLYLLQALAAMADDAESPADPQTLGSTSLKPTSSRGRLHAC